MPWLPILVWAFASQTPATPALDVSALKTTPTAVIDLDLGLLKGELRQIAWSPGGEELYVQTAEGDPPREKLHHYVVASGGGPMTPAEREPEWAADYWLFKSDRNAPGVPSLEIGVEQKREMTKVGTGSARPGTAAVSLADNAENASMAAEGQRGATVRFVLLGETISEFENQRPIPGLMFSWGPRGSGAIAFTDRQGHLTLLDQQKRKTTVAGVKDAILPAWSIDGERLAYAVKNGRRKYKLVWCTITK
jgi:hypothetical protein